MVSNSRLARWYVARYILIWSSVRRSIWLLCCVFGLAGHSSAQRCDVCTKNGVDMPISLAAGTVRTPEFAIKKEYYNIAIDVHWLLPTDELRCRMGFAVSPSDRHCRWESLLETKWRVLEGDRVVAEGLDEGWTTAFDASSQSLMRHVGHFRGKLITDMLSNLRSSKMQAF